MAIDYVNALKAGSGLDTKVLVEAIVGASRAPQQSQIDRRKSGVETEISGLAQLKSAMAGLRTAMGQLNDQREFSFPALSNSKPDNIFASFSNTGTQQAGMHEIKVTQLARQAVHVSSPQSSADGDLLGAQGTFTFTVGSNSPVTLTLAADNSSLNDLASAINAEDAGASARVIQTGDGNYQLFLESDKPGTANAVTVSAGLFGIDASAEQAAQDASFTYNGVSMSRSSNQVTDLIPGVDLDLMEADTNTTVRIEVSQGKAGAVAAIEGLVAAYNLFEGAAADLSALENAEGEQGALYGDSAVRALRAKFRDMFLDEGSTKGANIKRMGDMGVNFDRYGVLQLDSTKLEAALDSHYDEVRKFFTADTNDQLAYGEADRGLAGDLIKMVDDYLGAGGIMLSREQSNARLLTRIDEDQARLDTRMEDLEVRTTTQFTVMNRIMDEMKNLQSYLDSQMENLPFTKKND